MRKTKKNPFYSDQARRQEILTELGSQLRQLRQEKQLSLESIAAETRIQTRLLRAIEEGNLHTLPEPVYIQYFLRRYADVLGLDGREFARSLPISTGLPVLRASWVSLPTAQLRPVHLYLLYVVLIFFSVNGLSYLMNRSLKQAANPPVPAVQVDKTAENSLENTVSARPVSGKPDEQKVRVSLTINAESWIRIEADGKTKFEGILSQGTRKTWEANQQLIIRAGNAGGVLVTLNDGQTKTLGEPGKVEEVTFRANSRSKI